MGDEISPGLQQAIDDTRAKIAAAFKDRTPIRVRHVKRGSTYEVVAQAWLQTSKPLRDMEPMIVYRADDGTYWVRPESEFSDGRFAATDGE